MHSTAHLRALPVRPQPAGARAASTKEKMSRAGLALALVAFTLLASGFPSLRIRAGGMLVHPVTVTGAVLFVCLCGSLPRIPGRILLAMGAFLAAFTGSTLLASGGWGVVLKTAASATMILAAAMATRRESDFRWAVMAFVLAIDVISLRGLLQFGEVGTAGINPLEGIANKNGFSLFALPAVLLAAYMALRNDNTNFQRVVFTGSLLLTTFAIFASGNRSGWLGVVVIIGMLALRAVRRLRSLVLLIVLVGTASYLVMSLGNTSLLEHRLTQTTAHSGDLRWHLVSGAIEVGVKNPMMGVSPQKLPVEIARLAGVRGAVLDTHNVFALLFGGTGFVGFGLFLFAGYMLWRRPRGFRALPPRVKEAHYLLRCMLVLWVLRGQFTAEILYSPAFSLGLGLCIGLCVIRGLWTQPTAARAVMAGGR